MNSLAIITHSVEKAIFQEVHIFNLIRNSKFPNQISVSYVITVWKETNFYTFFFIIVHFLMFYVVLCCFFILLVKIIRLLSSHLSSYQQPLYIHIKYIFYQSVCGCDCYQKWRTCFMFILFPEFNDSFRESHFHCSLQLQ